MGNDDEVFLTNSYELEHYVLCLVRIPGKIYTFINAWMEYLQ